MREQERQESHFHWINTCGKTPLWHGSVHSQEVHHFFDFISPFLSLRRVSIEAGGNAPFIVFDDANLNEAVDGK